MARIVIVGGGITGLALAFRLRECRPDFDVAVLEAESRVGGNIQTDGAEDFQYDLGPNGFLDSKSSTLRLCGDLGLHDELVPASEAARRNRYILWDGKLRKLPGGLLGLLTTPLLSWRGKVALLREPFKKKQLNVDDESVAMFFRRRIGPEATRVFVDALVTGIHGGDAELLSMRAAFPRICRMEQEQGSIVRGFFHAARVRRREARTRGEPKPGPSRMWSFRGGMGRLPQKLAERLGQSIHCKVRVERIAISANERYIVHTENGPPLDADVVVLACPAWTQARILQDLDVELASELRAIEYAPIAVVAIGYRVEEAPLAPDGFGYLSPQQNRRDVLGIQWCSAIYPNRAPAGRVLWRALCGGWHRPEIIEWSDERLVAAVRDELRRTLGVRAAPAFVRIVRWKHAIPQYFVGHLDRVNRIEALAARRPGLILTGNALHGVAINDCSEQAEILAKRLSGSFASRLASG